MMIVKFYLASLGTFQLLNLFVGQSSTGLQRPPTADPVASDTGSPIQQKQNSSFSCTVIEAPPDDGVCMLVSTLWVKNRGTMVD